MRAALQRIIGELDEVLTRLEPGALHARDAAALLELFIGVERRGVAGRTLLADRAVDNGDWTKGGYRSPEEWLANKTGTNYGAAKDSLETSQKLKNLPGLEGAVRNASLSANQLNVIGPAATHENQDRLVAAAGTDSASQLRKRCENEKAKKRSEEEERARHARIHKDRHHRSWYDAEGAYCYSGRTTAERGARMDAALAAETENVFKAAYKRGPARVHRGISRRCLAESHRGRRRQGRHPRGHPGRRAAAARRRGCL